MSDNTTLNTGSGGDTIATDDGTWNVGTVTTLTTPTCGTSEDAMSWTLQFSDAFTDADGTVMQKALARGGKA